MTDGRITNDADSRLTDPNENKNPGDPGSLGYGGGGGGGGASGELTDAQKQAGNIQSAITPFNAQTDIDKLGQAKKALDVALDSARNERDWQKVNANKAATRDWFKRQQDLQAAERQLRHKMGNMFNGSGIFDLIDIIAQKDDQSDVDVLGTLEENIDNIDKNYYETLASNINSWNETLMNTGASLRDLFGDYVAQLANINPQLAFGKDQDGNPIDKFPTIVNEDDRSITVPDWFQKYLDEANYDKKQRGPVKPVYRDFTRPGGALETIQAKGLDNSSRNIDAAANKDYQSRLIGYSRR